MVEPPKPVQNNAKTPGWQGNQEIAIKKGDDVIHLKGREKIMFRRIRVLEMVGMGAKDVEIAKALNIHRNTVRLDRKAIKKEIAAKLATEKPSDLAQALLSELDTQYRTLWNHMNDEMTPSQRKSFVDSCTNITMQKHHVLDRMGVWGITSAATLTREEERGLAKAYTALMGERMKHADARSAAVAAGTAGKGAP